MALDVKVKINLTKPIGRAGFGYPLFVGATETSTKDAEKVPEITYKVCTSLDDLATAGVGSETSLYKTVALLLSQENAPEKFAIHTADLATLDMSTFYIEYGAKGWRQLIVVGGTAEIAAQVSVFIETTDDKVFFTSVGKDDETTSFAAKDRTVVMYYTEETNGVRPEAALVGATAGRDAGSFTYKNIILKGLDPLGLNDTEIAEQSTHNIITVVEKAGDVVTTEGKSMNGEYIDVIDSKDYTVQQIEYRTQKLLNQSAKIPYTNNGIAMLETVVVDVLQDCYNKGMVATNEDGSPAYNVEFALRENSSATDIANRKYIGGQFSFKIAGAIHEVEITGEIIV